MQFATRHRQAGSIIEKAHVQPKGTRHLSGPAGYPGSERVPGLPIRPHQLILPEFTLKPV